VLTSANPSRKATSARTLRRRLADADTSFQRVVDELRRELAASYLGDPGIKTAEVAFLLGFAEVSTFHRAFRRWTGTTPVAFRRRARERAPVAGEANALAGGAKARAAAPR
jgi:AraC-like DNA-binding protein